MKILFHDIGSLMATYVFKDGREGHSVKLFIDYDWTATYDWFNLLLWSRNGFHSNRWKTALVAKDSGLHDR